MNNDSGSEISFERQSSGRYSFKIPRPFATYDTTPADNLSFHNRSFKEDETHRLREDELKSLNGTLAKFYFDDIDYKPHEEYRPHENGKWNFVSRGSFEITRLYTVYWNWNVKMVQMNIMNVTVCLFELIYLVTFIYIYFILNILVKVNILIYLSAVSC